MKQDLPIRKPLRLHEFDYSSAGAYFITICTQRKKCLFSPVGADLVSARMVTSVFQSTINRFDGVCSPISVLMPNHFHAIIIISKENPKVTLYKIVQEFKSVSTLKYVKLVKSNLAPAFEKHLWQRSYYDRVIRTDEEYSDAYNYIYNNPLCWKNDSMYVE